MPAGIQLAVMMIDGMSQVNGRCFYPAGDEG